MYSCAPSFAVPRPGGSSFPVGLIEISHARISSAVGDRPTPYVGDWADPIWHIPSIISGRSLRKPIQHAPVARDLPRLHRVVVAAYPRFFRRVVPVRRDLGARRLHRAQFIGAARHEDTFFAVPLPVEPEACVSHGIRRRSKLGILPVLPAVSGDLHFANRTCAGPREATDFVESGTGQPLSARWEGDHRLRSNLERQ